MAKNWRDEWSPGWMEEAVRMWGMDGWEGMSYGQFPTITVVAYIKGKTTVTLEHRLSDYTYQPYPQRAVAKALWEEMEQVSWWLGTTEAPVWC